MSFFSFHLIHEPISPLHLLLMAVRQILNRENLEDEANKVHHCLGVVKLPRHLM